MCGGSNLKHAIYREGGREGGRDICTGRIHALICCTFNTQVAEAAEAAEEAAGSSVALVILFSSSILV